jgi:hypothetical protein
MKDLDEIMRFVEAELAVDPAMESSAIHERAKTRFPGVEDLSLRQFNARFPLQVKRQQAHRDRGKRRGRSPRARRGASGLRSQTAIREAFLEFASDLAATESREGLVRVVAGVDAYVDRVMDAIG